MPYLNLEASIVVEIVVPHVLSKRYDSQHRIDLEPVSNILTVWWVNEVTHNRIRRLKEKCYDAIYIYRYIQLFDVLWKNHLFAYTFSQVQP